jgi:inosine-uridine nucleoside N-ribohydrolase
MARKVVLLADPGIDGAFAIALALFDPDLDVIGLAATGGNVGHDRATKNVQILVEQLDPPRWPRLGAALSVDYETDATALHGPTGLGAADFLSAQLHHSHPSDKLLADLVRHDPKEVTVIALGPLTALARSFDLHPEMPSQVQRIVVVGGAWREPGDAGPVSEFHFHCDPAAARKVLRAGAPVTWLPLDVTRKLLFSPTDVLDLPAAATTRTGKLLRQIVPFGIGASSNILGIEGLYLGDVLGVVAVAVPHALATKPMTVDVETRGELTRGMSVVDIRPGRHATPNVEMAIDVDLILARSYMRNVLEHAE